METQKDSSWRPGPAVCRCCLAEGCYKDISSEYFWMGKREVYAEMLADTFEVSIAYSQAGGPNSNSRLICEPCISRLRDASEFKRQVVESERVFMNLLEPGGSTSTEVQSTLNRIGKNVKIELVKLEKNISDDDFDDSSNIFGDDDDDDDMDDEPLTKLATKMPKTESEDLLDFLKTAKAKVVEKKKSTVKLKAPPVKKVKKDVKPSSSKPPPPPPADKKKKKERQRFAPPDKSKENAKLLLRHSTAYPFTQHERKFIRCFFCTSTFEDPCQFRTHMDTEHPIDRTSAVNKKMVTRVDITGLRCNICQTPMDNLEMLADHLKNLHAINIQSQANLGLAPLKLERDRFNCFMCDKKFMGLFGLFLHASTHYLNNICDACGKNFETQAGLNLHVLRNHSGKVEITCKVCKESFPNKQARKDHYTANRACLPYNCKDCGERFTCPETLENHQVNAHGKIRKMFSCAPCNELFKTRTLLHFHFKLAHTNETSCQYCGQAFRMKRDLQDHIFSRHTGERPFKCNVCEMTFVTSKGFSKHVKIHDDSKKMPCTVCNRLFTYRWKLKDHTKRHHPEVFARDFCT